MYLVLLRFFLYFLLPHANDGGHISFASDFVGYWPLIKLNKKVNIKFYHSLTCAPRGSLQVKPIVTIIKEWYRKHNEDGPVESEVLKTLFVAVPAYAFCFAPCARSLFFFFIGGPPKQNNHPHLTSFQGHFLSCIFNNISV